MSLTIDGNANSITSSTAGVNIPATVDTLSVGPSGSYMIANSSGVVIGATTKEAAYKLKTVDASNPGIAIQNTGSGGGWVDFLNNSGVVQGNIYYDHQSNYMSFGTFNSGTRNERMRIDTVGRMTRPYQPAFFATGSGNVTPTAGNYIPFNTLNASYASANRSSGYNTGTYLYTVPVAGLYQFYTQIYLSPSTQSSITWWKNGAQLSFGNDAAQAVYINGTTTPSPIILSGSMILECAVNDYVGLQVRTGYVTGQIYMGHSSFWGYLIG